MQHRKRDMFYLALALALGIAGYLGFRAMYFAGEPMPFAQEMVLVFLGAVATIVLTAALLNRQTELELHKEARVLVLQQKSDIYMSCIEKIAEIVEAERYDPELIDDLRVLGHKLAVVGSRKVVMRFEDVLRGLLSGLRDGRLSGEDGEAVMGSLANMTAEMRRDFLQEDEPEQLADDLGLIQRNSRRMEQLDDIEAPGAGQ